LVEKLEKNVAKKKTLRVLILAPTRELAKQICSDFQTITSDLKCTSIYGGVRYEIQGEQILI
jgi:superfamily II DNA/RNA helicase